MKTPEGLVKPRILVAPLDWGLGHATRCVPIIHELLNNGCSCFFSWRRKNRSPTEKGISGTPFFTPERLQYSIWQNGTGAFWKDVIANSKDDRSDG